MLLSVQGITSSLSPTKRLAASLASAAGTILWPQIALGRAACASGGMLGHGSSNGMWSQYVNNDVSCARAAMMTFTKYRQVDRSRIRAHNSS